SKVTNTTSKVTVTQTLSESQTTSPTLNSSLGSEETKTVDPVNNISHIDYRFKKENAEGNFSRQVVHDEKLVSNFTQKGKYHNNYSVSVVQDGVVANETEANVTAVETTTNVTTFED